MTPLKGDWFSAFMDAAPEVYFRCAFAPARRFAYVSRAIHTLTGHAADAFLSDPAFCVSLVVREDRRVLRQIVRARRGLTTTLRLQRLDGTVVRVAIRTVPVVHGKRVVAVEGVATAVDSQPTFDFASPSVPSNPVQQRLAALLYEVHDLLHGKLPPRREGAAASTSPQADTPTLHFGDIVIDAERMTVTLAGEPVGLTTRELLVLRYLLQHQGRLVSRKQLLEHVWGYRYTGDDRTVDVHVSRLRKKLPPLRAILRAVKHLGYLIDSPESSDRRVANT